MYHQTHTVTPAKACVELADVFQHPLVEERTRPTSAQERALQHRLLRAADQACEQCPLLAQCLYRAVVEHDVAGQVAATSPAQRAAIRARLGIHVQPEDLDSLAGAGTPHRQIDPHEVLRLRAANPHDSLDSIAQRLGCSLSTVKRHLRRARNDDLPQRPVQAVRPSLDMVVRATREVLGRPLDQHAASRAA